MLYEALLMPVLSYSIETMIWGENERLRIRAVLMNLTGLLVLGEWIEYRMHELEGCTEW